jgi:hypothetical protein
MYTVACRVDEAKCITRVVPDATKRRTTVKSIVCAVFILARWVVLIGGLVDGLLCSQLRGTSETAKPFYSDSEMIDQD